MMDINTHQAGSTIPRRSHQPKLGLCLICTYRHNVCDHLPFEEMPVIMILDKINIVECTYFERKRDVNSPVSRKGC